MIPDEAIEAACRAEFSDWDTNGDEWWRGMTRKRVRLALEAAAPHMLAEAWGEGYGAGWNDCLLDLQNGGAKVARNPYG